MKVMHVLKHTQQDNGHVHVAVDLACAQADLGHDVMVVSSGGPYDDLMRDHGVRIVLTPDAGGVKGAVGALRVMAVQARRFRPDVIHAHMMSSAVLGAAVSRVSGAKLVTTVHNSFDGHSKLMRLGDRIIAISDAERELLLSRGFPESRLVTIANGPGGTARETLPRDDIGDLHQLAIMTLSGIHHRKAIDVIIEAFAELNLDFPDWHLNIVGKGPQEQEMRNLAHALALDGQVHFVGSTRTPAYLLDQAEIFVTASLAEPSGLNVIEARLAGCAIVASRVGGIPENLDDGAAGIMFEPGSPSALAAALRPLMEDEKLRRSWKERALAGAEERFGVHRLAQRHLQVYAELAGIALPGDAVDHDGTSA